MQIMIKYKNILMKYQLMGLMIILMKKNLYQFQIYYKYLIKDKINNIYKVYNNM